MVKRGGYSRLATKIVLMQGMFLNFLPQNPLSQGGSKWEPRREEQKGMGSVGQS